MMLPANHLSSTILPWIYLAFVLPIISLVLKRTRLTGINIYILSISIFSILLNIFNNIFGNNLSAINHEIQLIGIIIESICSLLILREVNAHQKFRKILIGILMINITAGLTIFMAVNTDFSTLRWAVGIAYALIFLVSAFSLLWQSTESEEYFLTDTPEFWVAAGQFMHFGLMILLLAVLPAIDSAQWTGYQGLGVMFTISICLRFITLATAGMVSKTSQQSN